MIAELLSTAKWQFHTPENNGLHFSFTQTKIPGNILLTKMPVELPSTEQIFTETSRLVPLTNDSWHRPFKCLILFVPRSEQLSDGKAVGKL